MFRQLSRQTVKTLPRSRFVYSRPVHNTPVPQLGRSNTEQQKQQRGSKWITSYSEMTLPEAEKRLGIRIEDLTAIEVDRMLANTKHSLERDVILRTKEMVYYDILRYIRLEGYPMETNPGFGGANVSDLVYAVISPIVDEFILKTGRNVRLRREKEIVSIDNETGGVEEFVVMDRIAVGEDKFVLIIEAKKSCTGEAMKQCLLSLKDARDNNGGGVVYGFITTGEHWRMISYSGTFQVTDTMSVTFHTMHKRKELWMKDYSVVVDCMHAALSNGGIQND